MHRRSTAQRHVHDHRTKDFSYASRWSEALSESKSVSVGDILCLACLHDFERIITRRDCAPASTILSFRWLRVDYSFSSPTSYRVLTAIMSAISYASSLWRLAEPTISLLLTMCDSTASRRPARRRNPLLNLGRHHRTLATVVIPHERF